MAAMPPRDLLGRAEPGFSVPAIERLAPPPPPELVAARIEAHSAPGDVVVDLHGRGGWVARAAIDRQRRAVTLESGPLTRLLAEVVLRPPDVRHLDAAFQALGASPRGETSLRLAIGDWFATRCATCGRPLVVDEVTWEGGEDGAPPAPTRKHYRCAACRDQQSGGEQRHAPLDNADLVRALATSPASGVRERLAERFPVPTGGEGLVEEVLGLHTPRQLAGLAAILERIESDLRAAPVESALRLAFLHAVIPSSRLQTTPGRAAALRIAGGRIRRPTGDVWRERNPWLAFEDGFRIVRGFVQRLEGGTLGPVQARFGEDLRSLGEGAATAVVRLSSPSALAALRLEAREAREAGEGGHPADRPRVRLVLGQPPARPTQDRIAAAWHGTSWALGREAASTIPLSPLFAGSWRAPWAWQAAGLRRGLEAVEPLLARDGRAVLFLDGAGPEALAAVALGGVGAGYRLVDARLAEPDEEVGGVVELVPPGASPPPGPRTRANVPLPPVPGGPGDPELVPGRGLFAPPERFDARPFSAADAARTVTEVAVETLRARGEPARTERLLGEILVGLDRAGQLRRLVLGESGGEAGGDRDDRSPDADGAGGAGKPPAAAAGSPRSASAEPSAASSAVGGRPPGSATARAMARGGSAGDPVERLVALIRDELGRPTQRRLVEIEPDRWWLAAREDRVTAAAPLADRVEWAVYSLLSTAGPLAESAFFNRIAALFGGHDLPDEALVRACLQSYRSLASTPDRIVTGEDLLRRSPEHAELLALLADGGHRLGMRVWIARREQGRTVDGRRLADLLSDRELDVYLPLIARAPIDELESVDCIWYVRNRATLLFEVEWTAMLGETLLRRHERIAQDDRMVRLLVVAPERTELVRYKLERSPLLRAAIEAGNWHVLKWNHLRAFLARDPLSLDDLEPYLGLDPVIERSGDQMRLFGE
jgi:hypothetical protein